MLQQLNRQRAFIFWLVLVVLGAAIGLGGIFTKTAQADKGNTAVYALPPSSPPVQVDDLNCRLCHGDSDKEIVFPSGETVSVQVDLAMIDHSVHGMAENPLICTDCHQPVNDYQFPHAPIETIDYRGYQLEKAVNCQRCHTEPHVNSHPTEGETAVGCTDCHGSHDVQPVDIWGSDASIAVCADCHASQDVDLLTPNTLTAVIHDGLFSKKADSAYCLSCHNQPDLTMEFPNGDIQSVTVSGADLDHSVHGADNSWQPLACADCHEIDSFPHQPLAAASAREYSVNRYTVCERCHEQNYAKEIDSVHGVALAEGNTDAAICTDCHGAHDTPIPNQPRERTSHICEQCHSEIFNEYKESIHGDALLSDGNPDVPTCIDCHGVHDIHSPSTALARSRSPQLCANCHADEEMMAQYDISTEVFDTYVADFHGATVTIFENKDPQTATNKAVCYDCHGVHDIKATDDPHAGIKDNLLVKCQECHPDATANFSDAWTSHFQPSLEHNPLVYLVNLFYDIVIPLTIGFFLFVIATDVYRRIRNKATGS